MNSDTVRDEFAVKHDAVVDDVVREMAAKTGSDAGALSSALQNMLQAGDQVTKDTAARIAEALGVNVSDEKAAVIQSIKPEVETPQPLPILERPPLARHGQRLFLCAQRRKFARRLHEVFGPAAGNRSQRKAIAGRIVFA
jgi:hypothetical protein